MPYNTNELLTQYKKSGLTRKEFCKKNSISLTALQYHFDKSKQVTSSRKLPQPGFIALPVSTPTPAQSTIVVIRGNYSPSDIASIINEAHG